MQSQASAILNAALTIDNDAAAARTNAAELAAASPGAAPVIGPSHVGDADVPPARRPTGARPPADTTPTAAARSRREPAHEAMAAAWASVPGASPSVSSD